MRIPNIVKNFEKSKNILFDLENIIDKNGFKFVDLFSIEGFSYWELSKPLLNLHVIPGITSKSNLYSFFSIIIRIIKRKLLSKPINEVTNQKIDIKPDILCVGFTNYINKDIFKPFLNELKNKNNFQNVALISDYNSKIGTEINCKELDIHSFGYKNFNNEVKFNFNKLIKNRKIFKFYLKNINNFQKVENINHFQLFKIILWIKFVFIPKYIPYVILSENIILSTKPKYVLEADIADPRNRAFILNAKKHSISTFTLQFAFYNRDSYEWFYALSDKIFVWGVWFLNLFNNNFKIANNRMIVVGSPRFDNLFKKNVITEIIDVNKKDILIISSYEIKSYKKVTKTVNFTKYITELIDTLTKEGYNIYIKLHPLEKNINYLNKYLDNGLQIVSFDNFHSVLNKVKIVITHGSTLTFDALIINKIICYPSSKDVVWWDDIFLQNNLGYGFENVIDLIELLIKLDQKESYKNNNLNNFIHLDNKSNSSSRIFDYLLNNKMLL